MAKLHKLTHTRLGFISILVILLWAKTVFAYFVDFNLGLDDPLQYILLIINPLGSAILLMSIALYFKNHATSLSQA